MRSRGHERDGQLDPRQRLVRRAQQAQRRRWIVRRLFGRDLDAERDRWLYVGDSTNDEPMFATSRSRSAWPTCCASRARAQCGRRTSRARPRRRLRRGRRSAAGARAATRDSRARAPRVQAAYGRASAPAAAPAAPIRCQRPRVSSQAEESAPARPVRRASAARSAGSRGGCAAAKPSLSAQRVVAHVQVAPADHLRRATAAAARSSRAALRRRRSRPRSGRPSPRTARSGAGPTRPGRTARAGAPARRPAWRREPGCRRRARTSRAPSTRACARRALARASAPRPLGAPLRTPPHMQAGSPAGPAARAGSGAYLATTRSSSASMRAVRARPLPAGAGVGVARRVHAHAAVAPRNPTRSRPAGGSACRRATCSVRGVGATPPNQLCAVAVREHARRRRAGAHAGAVLAHEVPGTARAAWLRERACRPGARRRRAPGASAACRGRRRAREP